MEEKTLESPLDCKEIKPVNPKGNQSWIVIGRTDAKAEAPIFWPPDVKNWLLRKDPDAGKDWRQEKKGTTEDEMVWWHHRLNGMSLSKLWELVKDREAWHAVVHGVTKSWTWSSDWTDWWLQYLTPGPVKLIQRASQQIGKWPQGKDFAQRALLLEKPGLNMPFKKRSELTSWGVKPFHASNSERTRAIQVIPSGQRTNKAITWCEAKDEGWREEAKSCSEQGFFSKAGLRSGAKLKRMRTNGALKPELTDSESSLWHWDSKHNHSPGEAWLRTPSRDQSRDVARSRASNVYLFCRLLVGALKTNGTRRGYREISGETCYRNWLTQETEKSRHLLCASQGIPKARGAIPSEFKGPRSREANGLSTRVWRPKNRELRYPRAEEDGHSAQEESESALSPSFCSSQALRTGRAAPHTHPLLYALHWFKC